jgi:LAS superfamily LD-carboxypeptidase LdcB
MESIEALFDELGYAYRITSTVRSHFHQVQLYRAWIQRGRTGLPVAPPGKSAHERGLAFDIAASSDALQLAGALAPTWGLRWGGDRDPVHFEAIA